MAKKRQKVETVVERRDWSLISETRAENGNSSQEMQCPFCLNTVSAYVWSFASVGKKCECGALLSRTGAKKRVPVQPCENKNVYDLDPGCKR